MKEKKNMTPKKEGSEIKKDAKSVSKQSQGGVVQELILLMIKMVGITFALIMVFTFVFGIYRSNDISMYPSIKDGDLVIFDRLDHKFIKSEVLVLKYKGEKQSRRVIAVEGDVVDISPEGLMINGSLQQEKEIYEKTLRYDTGVEFPMTIEKGQVFVMGDGREHATDSRVYGAVNIKDALGKVVTVIRRRGI